MALERCSRITNVRLAGFSRKSIFESSHVRNVSQLSPVSLALSTLGRICHVTLRLEGRSVSGDQFRAASDRVTFFRHAIRFPVSNCNYCVAAVLSIRSLSLDLAASCTKSAVIILQKQSRWTVNMTSALCVRCFEPLIVIIIRERSRRRFSSVISRFRSKQPDSLIKIRQ